MEELELQEKPGPFRRLLDIFSSKDEEEMPAERSDRHYQPRASFRCVVNVRRQVMEFEEAYAAAAGFKRGEQQIINLAGTDPALRQQIKDFISGVAFAQDGAIEEIGENIYLMAPSDVCVDSPTQEERRRYVRN